MLLGISEYCVQSGKQDFWCHSNTKLGIFISNYQIIKGTFLDGDSDAVGIMMLASGKSAYIISGSDDYVVTCNPDKIHCPSKLVDEESI